MIDPDTFKTALVDTQRLTREQLAEAEDYAREHGGGVDAALIDLSLLDYVELGECLSHLTSLPYLPLLDEIPSYAARQRMSYTCATRWHAVPVAYDSEQDVLTVAIADTDVVDGIRDVYRFLMQPTRLDFGITSATELERCVETYFPASQQPERKWTLRPLISGGPKARPDAAGTAGSPRSRWDQGNRFGDTAAESRYPYAPIRQAFLRALALLTDARLAGAEEAKNRARTRVHFAQALAQHLSLPAAQMDAVVISAWLSCLEDPAELLAQLDLPFAIAEILQQASSVDRHACAEAEVLALVVGHETFAEENPEGAADAATTRTHLRRFRPRVTRHDTMLDAFIEVLSTEGHFSTSASHTHRLLIVDPGEMAIPVLSPPLIRDGYTVEVVPSARAAMNKLQRTAVDAVVADVRLVGDDGFALCRQIKQRADLDNLPVILLGDARGEDQLAQALRAGADDFLSRPVDLELLFLKLQRVLTAQGGNSDDPGMRGSLDDVTFTDLIQILSAGGRRMELALHHDGRNGRVCLDGDCVVLAATDSTKGEDAFYTMMTWMQGEFEARQVEAFENESMRVPVMSLLMEGSRRNDEGLETVPQA